jgi:hypothetical protein
VNTNQNWSLLTGAALGASAMYLLDPGRGARRRALIRDQAIRATHKTGDALEALSRDVANRARGAAADLRSRFEEEPVSTRTLGARVRTELGRVVSHPRAIDVAVSPDGSVCLAGPILSGEAERAVAAIESVRGVCSVQDALERHDSPEGVPALQGGRTRPGRRSALLQSSWSPATQLMVGLATAAVAVGVGYAAWPSEERTEAVA